MKVPTRASEARFRDPDRKSHPPLSANSDTCVPAIPPRFPPKCLIPEGVNTRTPLAMRMPPPEPRRCGATFPVKGGSHAGHFAPHALHADWCSHRRGRSFNHRSVGKRAGEQRVYGLCRMYRRLCGSRGWRGCEPRSYPRQSDNLPSQEVADLDAGKSDRRRSSPTLVAALGPPTLRA
jgi:hypothetical protein